MTRRSALRASDADRDHVAERLRQAASDGRLLAHELEDRLARALRARTYGELDPLIDDLPGTPVAMVPRRRAHLQLARRYPLAVAIIGCFVGITLMAMVAATVALAASGLWLLPVILFFIFRGRGMRGRSPRRGDRRHVHVQVRRYGRFY